MNKDQIKLAAVAGIAVMLILAVAGFAYFKLSKAAGLTLELEEQLTSSKEETAAYRKYIDLLPQAKKSAIDAGAKLTTTMEDEFTWVEKGEKGVGPFKADGNAVIKMTVAYTFGFELAGGKFDLAVADKGIQIQLGQPQLMEAPGVTVVSADYPPKILAVDEDTATREIVQKAMPALEQRGWALAGNEAVRIIAERKLMEHLRGFFQKQKEVKIIPDMVVVYNSRP